jgi:CRP-like cAMP-binding protein
MLRYSDVAKSADEMQLRSPSQCPREEADPTIRRIADPPENDGVGLPLNPLIAKLRNFAALNHIDVGLLERLCRNPRTYLADHCLIQEDTRCGYVCLVISGLAFRYKILRNGKRQVLGYLIPGDICDLSFTLLDRADHSVSALIESRVVKIPIADLTRVLESSANVRRGMDLAAHLDNVIMRQWLVNIGQRKAHQKISHFLFEMSERLRMLGNRSQNDWIEFPLNQHLLADTIGTTPVHINRTLQRLRREGVIELDRRRLKILDAPKLIEIANFEVNYLNSIEHLV